MAFADIRRAPIHLVTCVLWRNEEMPGVPLPSGHGGRS